jgi:chromate transporter
LKLTAPLTAITSAVVGVILSLALFFAKHVFMPNQSFFSIDWFAVVLSIVAFIALFRFKLGIIKLILIYAVFGLALSYLH